MIVHVAILEWTYRRTLSSKNGFKYEFLSMDF